MGAVGVLLWEEVSVGGSDGGRSWNVGELWGVSVGELCGVSVGEVSGEREGRVRGGLAVDGGLQTAHCLGCAGPHPKPQPHVRNNTSRLKSVVHVASYVSRYCLRDINPVEK